MNWNAKKLWPTAALSLIAGSSLLCADYGDDARSRNFESRLAALECRDNCSAMVNPPARPFAKDCWGFYVAVDPFIWQAHENGMPIAIQTTNNPNFFNSSGENRVKNLDFHWNFGFRLAAGLNLDYDGWDTALTWTRWHTTAKRNFSAGQNENLFPDQGSPIRTFGMTAGSARGHWKLHLNQLDWELGREFYVSKHLTLRPFAGLRSAWINQKFTTTYNELAFNPLTPDTSRFNKAKSNYWGLGILGGIDTLWDLGCGWGIFADYSASLLYGYFKIDADEYSSPRTGIVQRTDNFYHLGRAITDMQLGVRYDWVSCDECYHLGFEAGWEHHMFWGQNQFIYFVDSGMSGAFVSNQGDLTTQGYFLRVRFDF